MDFIERNIAAHLQRAFVKSPTVTLTGPRQAGKSTLLKAIFPNLPYVNLESLNTRSLALSDPEGFVEQYKEGAIFDEVQRAPELFSAIQVHVDKVGRNSLYVLSGSQNFLLLEQISQSLAGRTLIFHLPPLSINETKNKFNFSLEEQIFTGGYPRIYDQNLNPTEWLGSYVQTVIEKDIRTIKNVTNLEQFRLFVQMCANRSGQILDLTSLGNDCGISSNTAKSWLSMLETSFIVFKVQPYYRNFNKRLIKSPKLYFWDSGLLCYLLKIKEPSELIAHSYKGNIFETFIISEIKKYFLINNINASLYFWHDKSHEVDCLIEMNSEKLYAMEIKSGKTYANDFKKSLAYLSKIIPEIKRYILLYAGESEQNIGNIELTSADKLTSLLKSFQTALLK